MKHALASFERDRKRAAAPRPPSFRGSKLNQFRRQVELESWYRQQTGFTRQRLSQETRDRAALGHFLPWVTAARAEAGNARRVAKAQAALRHAAGK